LEKQIDYYFHGALFSVGDMETWQENMRHPAGWLHGAGNKDTCLFNSKVLFFLKNRIRVENTLF
jgi:hypothetical protein